MNEYPTIEEADSITDWVVKMSVETDIDPYKLWVIAHRLGRDREEKDEENGPPRFDELLGEVEAGDDPPVSPTAETDESPRIFDQPVGSSGDGVSQDEYYEFQEKVREVIENLIEFLIAYDMLGGSGASDRQDVAADLNELAAAHEDDASSFFTELKSVLEGATAEPEAVDESDEEEMAEFLEDLQTSIAELEELGETFGRDKPTVSPFGDERGFREFIGDLNRILDSIDDYPGLERDEARVETDGWDEEAGYYDDYGYDEYDEYDEYGEYGEYGDYEDEEEYWEREPAPSQTAMGFQDNRESHRKVEHDETEGMFSAISSVGMYPIDLAWIGAAFTYGGTDMFSTAMVLEAGGRELNPMYDILGGSLTAFVIWKTFVLFILFVMFYPKEPSHPSWVEWFVPLIVAAAGVLLTVSNLLVLI